MTDPTEIPTLTRRTTLGQVETLAKECDGDQVKLMALTAAVLQIIRPTTLRLVETK